MPDTAVTKVAGFAGSALRQVLGVAATIVQWIGLFFALILVAHIVLTVGGANAGNPITTFVRGLADPLSLQFRDLFPIHDATLTVVVNYGLAAIFWLIVTAILVKALRKVASLN